MKRCKLATLFIAAFTALLLCGQPAFCGQEVADELTVLIGSDASTFDPHFCTDSATEIFNKNIYSNLVRFNAEMKLQPELAESWTVSEDGRTWTFILRKDVTFHDGTPFDAAAVKTCLDRVLDKNTGSPRRSVLSVISSVATVDQYKVNITTAVPCGSLLQRLAHPVAAMISPTAIAKYGKELATHPVGTGAFKFVAWEMGERLVLERNEKYFAGAPKVQQVVFQIVPEDATRSMLLQAGQADVALRLPVAELERLKDDPGISMIRTDTVMTMYVALNNSRGALRDVRVRQALNYAVDKSVVVRDILGGMATVADAPISPYTWGYSPCKVYVRDIAKAKELLAQAGYPNGLELTLWTPVGRYLMDTQVSENLQAQWAEAGIRVTIRQWEFQALMSEVKKGQFDMVLLGWSPSTGDADQGLYPVFHSTQFPPRSNRAFYSNAEVDRLLVAAQSETYADKRYNLYKQAQSIITDEAAWTFLYYPRQAAVFRKEISGLEVLPTEHILLAGVTKK